MKGRRERERVGETPATSQRWGERDRRPRANMGNGCTIVIPVEAAVPVLDFGSASLMVIIRQGRGRPRPSARRAEHVRLATAPPPPPPPPPLEHLSTG